MIGPPPTAGYPNSATIDYSNFHSSVDPVLTAIVSDNPPTIAVNDQAAPAVWMPAPIPAPPGSFPDVTIGNDLAAPGNYIAAVVATMPCSGGNDVFLFLYHVVGPPPYTLAPAPYAIYNISSSCNVTGPAHIDIIAQYSTPIGSILPPLPQSNQFVITWQDVAQGIMGYYANLNNPASGTPTVIDGNLNCSSPDVAAVERLNAGFEDWALFSYVDMTGPTDILYENEWNITGAAITGPAVYDNTLLYLPYSVASTARIDAIDDFNQNMPAGPNAYFDIVVSEPLPGPPFGAAVVEYNNITGPFAATDITSAVVGISGNKNIVPVVACGPGSFYTVGYMSDGPLPPPSPSYYASSVDWTTGLSPIPPVYQINLNPWGPSPGFPFGLALSASCNIDNCPTQQLFACWENNGRLWEKYDGTPPLCPPGYSFRQTPSAVPVVAAIGEWQLSPNPASDHLSLTAPTGFNLNNGAAYSITDMAGRTMMQNPITDASEDISVDNLSTGMYLLNIHANETSAKTMKFVKE